MNARRYLIPFRATLLPQIFTDVLVVGGGVAGLRAALAAVADDPELEVILTSKAPADQSNTAWAQGGIAAVVSAEDTVDEHVADTLAAGGDLCDEPIVRRVVEGGTSAIRDLLGWGMPMDRVAGDGAGGGAGAAVGGGINAEDWNGGDGGGTEEAVEHARLPGLEGLALGREGGHGRHRVVHTDGDATGRALSQTLGRRVGGTGQIRHFNGCFVLDLLTTGGGGVGVGGVGGVGGNGGSGAAAAAGNAAGGDEHARVIGAITHHPQHGLQVIWASAVVLASGGAGQVYRESTNPTAATGDGVAMAWRAGAELQDLSFVQFHPTTLYVAGASRALVTEAVRGEGAHLIDRQGERFMPAYDPRAELAPRDVVSRSILRHMAATGTTHVYLDTSPSGRDRFVERFPGIAELLRSFEIDPGDPIPVHPSAHYFIGGVRCDADGQTSLPGLYAAGEVSASGLHGANRLASNSLLEGMVLGERAGRAAAAAARTVGLGNAPHARIVSDIRPSDRSALDLADVRSSLRSVMWRHVGIVREGDRLDEVQEMFDFWARYTMDKIFDDIRGWEVQNLLTVGTLITRAARWRCESRGVHFRADHPEPRDTFRVHDLWRRPFQPTGPQTRPVAVPDTRSQGVAQDQDQSPGRNADHRRGSKEATAPDPAAPGTSGAAPSAAVTP